jgi:hypothetical protein
MIDGKVKQRPLTSVAFRSFSLGGNGNGNGNVNGNVIKKGFIPIPSL